MGAFLALLVILGTLGVVVASARPRRDPDTRSDDAAAGSTASWALQGDTGASFAGYGHDRSEEAESWCGVDVGDAGGDAGGDGGGD